MPAYDFIVVLMHYKIILPECCEFEYSGLYVESHSTKWGHCNFLPINVPLNNKYNSIEHVDMQLLTLYLPTLLNNVMVGYTCCWRSVLCKLPFT